LLLEEQRAVGSPLGFYEG